MRAFIDSNIFIYAAQAHPEFGGDCKRIIAGIERGEIDAVTSTLNISEVGEAVARYVGRKASMEVLELLLALPMGSKPSKRNISYLQLNISANIQ